jgi:hypothetical protein
VISYININSLRYKFDEIKELLTENIVVLLLIADTKLDSTFIDNLLRSRNSPGVSSLTPSIHQAYTQAWLHRKWILQTKGNIPTGVRLTSLCFQKTSL